MSAVDLLGLGFPLCGVAMLGLLYCWFRRLPDASGPGGDDGSGGRRDRVEPCGWPAGGRPRQARRSSTRRSTRAPARR